MAAQTVYDDGLPLSVATFNMEAGGYVPGKGHPKVDAMIEHLLRCFPDGAPAILCLSEATKYEGDGEQIARYVTNTLSEGLPRGEYYEPFMFDRPGWRNPPMLLLNRAKMTPLHHFRAERSDTGPHYQGVVRVDFGGIKIWIKAVHWPGVSGRDGFWREANYLAQGLASQPSIVLGDFNSDDNPETDWEGICTRRGERRKLNQKGIQLADGRWVLDDGQLRFLLDQCEYRDLGELAGDLTGTTTGSGLRIDRILLSRPFPGSLVDYKVHVPEGDHISDHFVVSANLMVTGAK